MEQASRKLALRLKIFSARKCKHQILRARQIWLRRASRSDKLATQIPQAGSNAGPFLRKGESTNIGSQNLDFYHVSGRRVSPRRYKHLIHPKRKSICHVSTYL